MRLFRTCSVLAAAAALLAAVPAGVASAQAVSAGTLVMTGDPGDRITDGSTVRFDTAAGDTFRAFAYGSGGVDVQFQGADGYGSLYLTPPAGQQLTAGSTYAFDSYASPAPYLTVGLNNRGCGAATGSYTVTAIDRAPDGSLDRLALSFEFYCERVAPVLRGSLDLDVTVDTRPLTVTPTLARKGTVDPRTFLPTVGGTVTCNETTQAEVTGVLSQVTNGVASTGYFSVLVPCGPRPRAWTAAAYYDSTGFFPGVARLEVTVRAEDPDSFERVEATATRDVRLSRR